MPRCRPVRLPVAILALSLAGWCSAVPAGDAVHVLVIPVEFEVSQVTAGGVPETLADESVSACGNLNAAIAGWLESHPVYVPVEYPPLSEDEESMVREHVALFNVAMNEAWTMIRRYDRGPFDYTIGDGLGFIAERTAADKVIVVAGARRKSTGGRTALKVFEFMLFGVLSPLEQSFLSAGIIDLETGRIEWANLENVSGEDVEHRAEAEDAVAKLMSAYPGGDFSVAGSLP